jgi:hypothetical protein
MASLISEGDRRTFAALADILIPAAEGMPAATEVDVQGEVTDRLLGLRPDLVEAFKRGCAAVGGKEPQAAAEWLNANDTEALSAIGLVASAAYYMNPKVRELIGYPGQESRPADPDEEPEYIANGMLKVVQDRGPIYRKA